MIDSNYSKQRFTYKFINRSAPRSFKMPTRSFNLLSKFTRSLPTQYVFAHLSRNINTNSRPNRSSMVLLSKFRNAASLQLYNDYLIEQIVARFESSYGFGNFRIDLHRATYTCGKLRAVKFWFMWSAASRTNVAILDVACNIQLRKLLHVQKNKLVKIA